MSRIVCIDYGLKRIGLAISDEMKIIATPLETFQAKKQMQETVIELLKLLEKYAIEEIVVGLPLKMNGSMGMIADEVMEFVELLKKETPIPVVTWDERLTSVQAERAMKEGGVSRKKRTKSVDQIAAVIMLQSYLEKRYA